MLRYNQKSGDLALTPSALAGLAVLVCGFGGWMTAMQSGVSQISSVAERVSNIERILTYNHIDISKGERWPDPTPASPRLPLSPYSASPAVALDRRVLDSAMP